MHSPSSAFLSYFESEFFSEKKDEFLEFQSALLRPLKKTIRINTRRIGINELLSWLGNEGWTFTPTEIPSVFQVDREDRSIPLGSTLPHILGLFYIQEESATHSVHTLQHAYEWKQQPQLILDLAASPGGKTTQLAEAFPGAFILANESSKDRLPQLIDNTERMGSLPIGIVCDDGRRWGDRSNAFDSVLLDAPCSGEGIAWKESSTLAHWHMKKIRSLAKLQSSLIESAFRALKPGGYLLYSTCTLNRIENEGVLTSLQETHGENVRIVETRRFWPHEKARGGFFTAVIEKLAPTAEIKPRWKVNTELAVIENAGDHFLRRCLDMLWVPHDDLTVYRFRDRVLGVPNTINHQHISQLGWMTRFGQTLGFFDHGTFRPEHFLVRDREATKVEHYDLSEEEITAYLTGATFTPTGTWEEGAPIVLTYGEDRLGISRVSKWVVASDLPSVWRRR